MGPPAAVPPGGLHRAALLAAARQAFTVGLLVTAIISAAVAVGIAVLATVLLRGVPGTSEAAPTGQPAIATGPDTVAQPGEPVPPKQTVQLIRAGGVALRAR